MIDPEQGPRLKTAMRELGQLWGLRRNVRPAELGRALRLGPGDPGGTVRNWLENKTGMPGPASMAIEMMLLGALPADGLESVILLSPFKGKPKRGGPSGFEVRQDA